MRRGSSNIRSSNLSQIVIGELCTMCRRLLLIVVSVTLELCVGVGALPRFRSGRPLRDCSGLLERHFEEVWLNWQHRQHLVGSWQNVILWSRATQMKQSPFILLGGKLEHLWCILAKKRFTKTRFFTDKKNQGFFMSTNDHRKCK
jgi:hypothetical protein